MDAATIVARRYAYGDTLAGIAIETIDPPQKLFLAVVNQRLSTGTAQNGIHFLLLLQ